MSFQRVVSSRDGNVSELRHAFADWLSGYGVEGRRLDDWELVFSELAANAFAASEDDDDITVESTCRDGEVHLAIVNVVHEGIPTLPATDPPPTAQQGRGLFIARNLTEDLTVEPISVGHVRVSCWAATPARV